MRSGSSLTGGRLLARNTAINLLSELAPFLVAIFCIPALIAGIGVARYGVLTLSMMVAGYLGLFDFGLGRAATKFIAEAAALRQSEKIPGLFWTSLYLLLGFGSVAGLLAAILSPWLVDNLLKIPFPLRSESVHAFWILAFSLPFAVSGSSLYGTLSALQRFDLINLIRAPAGIFSYLGPLFLLPFSHSVCAMVGAMVLVRIVAWLMALLLCLRVFPALRDAFHLPRAVLSSLLTFGGWVAVTGAVGPLLAYFDRFLIAGKLSVAAVSYYTVPFQITSKTQLLPVAMGGVIFSAFSGAFADDPERAAVIFERGARYALLAVFPPVLLAFTFAREGLALWIDPSFAIHSCSVFRLAAIAAFVTSVASIPYTLIQALRPDLTAKVHVAEVPLYLALLWTMLARRGIEGVAFAYAIRVAADAIVLFVIAPRLLPPIGPAVKRVALLMCVTLALIGAGAVPMDRASRLTFATLILVGFAAAAWIFLIPPDEKAFFRDAVRPLRVLATGTSKRWLV
jgi:O-antigen/teichoic acid export membrane protein